MCFHSLFRYFHSLLGGWLEELELKQALKFCSGLGLCKTQGPFQTIIVMVEERFICSFVGQSGQTKLVLREVIETKKNQNAAKAYNKVELVN